MICSKFFIAAQYLLPQHLLSRALGLLAHCRVRWIKNAFIKWFIKRYNVNMQEALRMDVADYVSFNDFFTRKLKPGARVIDASNRSLICPVDGSISQVGSITHGRIIQAKGFDFTVTELLGGDNQISQLFQKGLFATLYLAPKDYHCIHMPFAGTLQQMIHIPGDLFSVNQTTVNHVPQLFARNERVVCLFKTTFGAMAVVLVGAFFVASIQTTWAGTITPPRKKSITRIDYSNQSIQFNKGDLIADFQLGSTVIVLLPQDVAAFCDLFVNKPSIQMGEAMAKLIEHL